MGNYRTVNIVPIVSTVARVDAKSDKFTHKIFFVAIPVWLKRVLTVNISLIE